MNVLPNDWRQRNSLKQKSQNQKDGKIEMAAQVKTRLDVWQTLE